MLNVEVKARVLSDGTYGRYVAYRRASFFSARESISVGEISEETEQKLNNAILDMCEITEAELVECGRLYSNGRLRAKRLRKRIEAWSRKGFVYFCTLTFRDEVFEKTSEETRRRYVSYFLKSLNSMYCANLDYGGQFEREHYHAIICVQDKLKGEYRKHKGNTVFDCSSFDAWNEKYGFTCVQGPILCSSDADKNNSLKVAKYTAKASNHALKETTRQHRLIYSRGECPWSEVKVYDYNDGFFTVTDAQLEELPFDVNE